MIAITLWGCNEDKTTLREIFLAEEDLKIL
jgi:hypothetical protein